MKIYLKNPYLWMPVDKKDPEVKLHFYCGEIKFQEVDIQLGGTDGDFYTAMDVSRYQGSEIEIRGNVPEEKLYNIFCYKEEVQNVYPFRPQIHFAPRIGWHNDPNGLVYANGIYHLYYQWNPYGVIWGNMHWGHAVSRDLITWEHRPMVMEPDIYGTVYSGCGWQDTENRAGFGKDALLFFYTAAGGCSQWSADAGNEHTQRLAVSKDGGETLHKIDGTLIEHIVGGNRDPKIFYHSESKAYIMVLFMDGYEFSIFRSEDLIHWKESQRFSAEKMRECPDLFELPVEGAGEETRWVFWSADGYYLVGSFDGYCFAPESDVQSAYSTVLAYAAQTYAGLNDRVIGISWLRLENDRGNYRGAMSLPVEMSLAKRKEKYRILFRLPEELKAYRYLKDRTVTPDQPFKASLRGIAAELAVKWKEQESGIAKVQIGGTLFTVDFEQKKINIINPQVYAETKEICFDQGKEFTLDFVIDQEIIEFFGDGGTIYGAVETEENILRKNIGVDSSAEIETIKFYELMKGEKKNGSKEKI